jgi:hypothetical protein
VTHMLSASKRTPVASAEVLIPCPFYPLAIRFDNSMKQAKRPCTIAIFLREPHFRSKPEFSLAAIFLNVNMYRLARRSFVRIEEETKSAFARDFRHALSLSHSQARPPARSLHQLCSHSSSRPIRTSV